MKRTKFVAVVTLMGFYFTTLTACKPRTSRATLKEDQGEMKLFEESLEKEKSKLSKSELETIEGTLKETAIKYRSMNANQTLAELLRLSKVVYIDNDMKNSGSWDSAKHAEVSKDLMHYGVLRNIIELKSVEKKIKDYAYYEVMNRKVYDELFGTELVYEDGRYVENPHYQKIKFDRFSDARASLDGIKSAIKGVLTVSLLIVAIVAIVAVGASGKLGGDYSSAFMQAGTVLAKSSWVLYSGVAIVVLVATKALLNDVFKKAEDSLSSSKLSIFDIPSK